MLDSRVPLMLDTITIRLLDHVLLRQREGQGAGIGIGGNMIVELQANRPREIDEPSE
jgi:hypothetical protein